MRTRAKLQPGQPGTKALLKIHGDQLICVLYRYDHVRRKRYKTVELIVAEADWTPPAAVPSPETLVSVRVAWGEAEIAQHNQGSGRPMASWLQALGTSVWAGGAPEIA